MSFHQLCLVVNFRPESTYGKNAINFRVGAEMKVRLFGEYAGLLLKGSTSFFEDTFFLGIGLSLGYFN